MNDLITIRVSTDTASPQAAVPIYLIHSIAHPFCALPGCWCRSGEAEVSTLLAAIGNGALMVQYAVSVGASHPQGKEPRL
jgi:hypothetical protein